MDKYAHLYFAIENQKSSEVPSTSREKEGYLPNHTKLECIMTQTWEMLTSERKKKHHVNLPIFAPHNFELTFMKMHKNCADLSYYVYSVYLYWKCNKTMTMNCKKQNTISLELVYQWQFRQDLLEFYQGKWLLLF